MKIISNFHDYYDGVQSYGQDNLTYIRKERIFKIKIKNNTIRFPHLYYRKNKEFSNIKIINSYLIGFCGQFYKIYEIEIYKKNIDLISYKYGGDLLYNKNEFDRYNLYSNDYFKFKIDELFKVENNEYLYELFFKYKTPCYIIKHFLHSNESDRVIINPNLKKYKFYKIKDAFTAYQEISMFLGGVLSMPFKPVVDIEDKYKIQSHGFDKWSFKKLPTKRRK
jgi:hypothetical protein